MVFLIGFSAGTIHSIIILCSTKVIPVNIALPFCAPLTAVVTLLNEPKKGGSKDTDNQNVTKGCKKLTFKTIAFTTLELFKFTIGMGDLEFTEEYEYKHVFYMLLISYLVLTYILLLNMLIALMSKTVDGMYEESTNIWKLQVYIQCPVYNLIFVPEGNRKSPNIMFNA